MIKRKIIIEGCDGAWPKELIAQLVNRYKVSSFVHGNVHDEVTK